MDLVLQYLQERRTDIFVLCLVVFLATHTPRERFHAAAHGSFNSILWRSVMQNCFIIISFTV